MRLEFTGDTGPVQRNFDTIAQLAVTAGDESAEVRFGTTNATWTASQDSAAVTVTHGLGRAPAAVAAVFNCIGSGQIAYAIVNTPGATTFQVQGRAEASFSGSLSFYWIAIG